MDPTIEELFQKTLQGDYDDDEPWAAVSAVRKIATQEVFDRSAEWCLSSDPLKRSRGYDILGQIGNFNEALLARAFEVLAAAIVSEEDVRALNSVIHAIGHTYVDGGGKFILPYVNHADPTIRRAVAFALSSFHDEADSVGGLMTLMRDVDEDVRDWATFGVGSMSTLDSPTIREALLRNTADPNIDVREEAIDGLAQRKDERVLPLLFAALETDDLPPRIAEACSLMLGFDCDPEGWGVEEYRAALTTKFPNAALRGARPSAD